MNTSIESIERNLCKTLMEKLPFPAKETFLVAYNRGWATATRSTRPTLSRDCFS